MSRPCFLLRATLVAWSLVVAGTVHAGGLSYIEYYGELLPGPPTGADLNRVADAVVSPDGLHVYTIGETRNTLLAFSRGLTGALTHVETEEDGIGGVDGMRAPSGLAISSDGNCVYVAARQDDAVTVFSRNPGTGALTFVEFQQDGAGGVDGIGGATDVAVAPNGLHVYATGETDSAVATFGRTPPACALTFVEVDTDPAGLIGLSRAQAVAVSPADDNVYVAGRVATGMSPIGAVAAFTRNPVTGALTYLEHEQNGAGGVVELAGNAPEITVSPDGISVLVASRAEDAVVVFDRDLGTGALTFLEAEREGGTVKGVKGASSVDVDPNNAYVYVTGRGSDSVVVFRRNTSSGALDYLEQQLEPETKPNPLGAAFGTAVSPDGTNLYVGANRALSAWTIDVCGDGNTGTDEHCDDGNLLNGDGCSDTCRLELCPAVPNAGCLQSTALEGSQLQIKDDANDTKDQLQWKWNQGAATLPGDLGDPVAGTTSYQLCLYAGGSLVRSPAAPAQGVCKGKPCWKAVSGGFQYKDTLRTPDGLTQLAVKSGVATKAKIGVKARGVFLQPGLPLALPVDVQLYNTSSGTCWRASFSTNGATNASAQFKAKGN